MIFMLNNKSNFTKKEYLDYQKKLFALDKKNSLVVVFPSNVYLPMYEDNEVRLGSQNVSKYDLGSHTGEVCASQLKSLGVEYSIVGHSERRRDGESDNDINEKIKRLVDSNIKIVLCVGETIDERKSDNFVDVVIGQIKRALEGIEIDYNNLIVAYEPIWAIGTGKVPTSFDIEKMAVAIKNTIPVKVLYGGSVDDSNIESVLSSSIDGFLLGKSSLDVLKLKRMIDKI